MVKTIFPKVLCSLLLATVSLWIVTLATPHLTAASPSVTAKQSELDEINRKIREAEQANDQEALADAYVKAARVYLKRVEHEQVQKYLQKALLIAEEKQLAAVKGQVFDALAILYLFQGLLDEALETGLNAAQIYSELKDNTNLSKQYNTVGRVYYNLANYDKAIEYYHLSLALKGEKDLSGKAMTLAHLARSLHLNGNNSEARVKINEALAIGQEHRFPIAIGISYNVLGMIELSEGNPELAKEYYLISNTYYVENGDFNSSIFSLKGAATASVQLGQVETARIMYEQALELCKKAQKKIEASEIHTKLAEIAQMEGDSQSAYRHAHEAIETYREGLITHRQQATLALQQKHDFALKQREVELLKKDAELANWEIRRVWLLAALLSLGTIAGIAVSILMYRKVGDSKRLREAREAADAANRAKSEFLANLSHEVRTPMTGIILSSELLLGAALTDEAKEQVRNIQVSAQAMVTILDDVLDFARVEAGVIHIDQEDFDLIDLLQSTYSMATVKGRAKGLTVTTDVSPNLPRWVRGDSVRLRQVLNNLLDNAIKFTSAGKVYLKVEPVGAEHVIRFAVHDTGPGISPEDKMRIFQRFFQIDGSSMQRNKGAGLGLAIVSNLVSLMAGSMGVHSDLGQGSVFWFEIPLERRTEPLSDINTTGLPQIHGLRVLLVEDNDINRRITVSLLTRLGAVADEADSGWDALKKMAHTVYDLVLMDIQMPGLDGCQTVKLLRGPQGPELNRHVPVVAFTAGITDDERERCLEAGMSDFLLKPFTSAQLRNLLEKRTNASQLQFETKEVFCPSLLLEYIGHDREVFADCLVQFPVLIGPVVEKIASADESVQRDELKRLAHLLKGAAAGFAAPRLRQAAVALEEALSDGSSLQEASAKVAAEYECLLQEVSATSVPPV